MIVVPLAFRCLSPLSPLPSRVRACCPRPALRSLVRVEAHGFKLASHRLDNRIRIVLDVKIPEPQHSPASLSERVVVALITGDVPLDLLVPVALPPAGLPLARMAMPERAVNEDSDPPPRKCNVYPAAGSTPVAPEPAETGMPQRRPEQPLGTRVRTADAYHDASTAFRRSRRRAERV